MSVLIPKYVFNNLSTEMSEEKSINIKAKQSAQELATFLLDQYNMKWPSLGKKINEKIDQLKPKFMTKRSPNDFARIMDGKIGKSFEYEWWKECEAILQLIINDLEKKNPQTTFLTAKKKTVRFGVFPCQDTILPVFFESSYRRNLIIKWKEYKNWSDGIDAFRTGDVDVILHNFSTVIANNTANDLNSKLIFIPYFYFNGYGVLIKRDAIKQFIKINNLKGNEFNEFSREHKKEFLEQTRVILERNTDFEWAYKNYCSKFGCSLEIIDSLIYDQNTNYGKDSFLKNNKYSIYCTNSVHFIDLLGKKYNNTYTLAASGENMTNHYNSNGLICEEQFYNENKDIIMELNGVWFNMIEFFLEELRNVTAESKIIKQNLSFYYTVNSPISFLKQYTNSEVSLNDLRDVYESYNIFFINEKEAINSFYNDQLNNRKIIDNYYQITQIQMGKDVEEFKVKEFLNSLKAKY